MAKRGTTVRASRLSVLLKPIGKFAGAEDFLVTIKSEVYKDAPDGSLKYVCKFVQLGSMVREREMEFKRYLIVPNDKGGFDYSAVKD